MKNHVFRGTLWFFTIVVVFLLSYSSKSQADQNQTKRRHVLLLHSYHKGMTWVDDITNSVTATLSKTDPGIELHVEYMDTKRVLGEEHLGNLYTEYRFKFKQVKFDAVVIVDDDALRFVLKHYDALFPETPVIFCGINSLEPGMLANRPGFTGILEHVDVADTLKIALALHPDARRVYIINDMSASGKGLHKEIAKAANAFATRAEFTFLEDYTADELAEIISKIPSNSIILRSAFFVDKSGRSLPNEKISYAAVGRNARVPVYSLWDFYMGLGIVGGKVVSGTAQGELAAQLATRILKGEKPSTIPVIVKSPNRLMFDYQQMQRFGIDRSSLPPGSAVVNEPLPFYAINKALVWTGVIFTLAMTFVTVLLVLNINRRKQTEEALLQSEYRWKFAIEGSGDGVWDWNIQTGEAKYTKRWQEMLGYAEGDILPTNREWVDRIHPDDQSYVAGAMQAYLDGKTAIYVVEYRLRCKDESYKWILGRGMVVSRSGDGNPLRMIGTHTDITPRKEHEKEQLKIEKLESLGVLAGGIAHDFNNILTGIMGNISFAQMFLDSSHKSYKPLAEAEKASARAAELAHQLLTFSRGGEPIKKVISVQHLVNETVSLVLHGSNVKGTVDIPDSIHAIEADEGQISQVFHNIIINAMQAMPGGGTLTVTAQNEQLCNANTMALPGGSYVRLSFYDQGCGIPDDILKRIFDPYFTTKPAGNGLGLASVHSIVSRHGGHVGASSIVGKGTTFTIHLPSICETYSKHQTESVTQTTGDHTGGSILVMDDEEMIRDMTTEMLEYLGYKVTTCENGAGAITRYKTAKESGAPFSAVIMDLTIPGGMGGKETAQQILAIDPKACLIVSSGYSNDPIMSDYSTFGFTGALAKPYNIKELGQQLSLLLSAR